MPGLFGNDNKHLSECHILDSEIPLISRLQATIRLAVQALAVLMTFVIVWGILDVVYMLYQKLATPPYFLLSIHDILATFGAFMAVLIAIEIFANITMYLKRKMIHVRLVLATAIMAAARKVIVLDFKVIEFEYVWALGAVLLGLGGCYYLVCLADRTTACGPEEPGVAGTPDGDTVEESQGTGLENILAEKKSP